MLLRRGVPSYVVEIVAYCSAAKFIGVANNSVEIAFRGGNEVRVIHKDGSWEVIPSPYTILGKGSCKCYPCGTCKQLERCGQ